MSEEKNKKTYKEGYFVGRWMVIGMITFAGIGVPLSVISGNQGLIGIGPAFGMSVGIAIGSAIEEKYRKQGLIEPKNKNEKISKKSKIAILLAILGVAVVVLILFLLRT
jgi:hypothetical protein